MTKKHRAAQHIAGGDIFTDVQAKAEELVEKAVAKAEKAAEKAVKKAETAAEKADKQAEKNQQKAENPKENNGKSEKTTSEKTESDVVQQTPDLSGNDWLNGVSGPDTYDGGAGVDTVSYSTSPDGVEVNLTTGLGRFGDAEGDTYASVENVHGSSHNDVIIGDDQNNRLVGRDGEDVLRGEGGDDHLLGGRNADILDGGAGVDTAEYDWSTSGVDVNLTTGIGQGGYAEGDVLSNIENVSGSYHDDTLTGDEGVNRLFGDDGNDVLNGMSGNDILVGGQGADVHNGGEGDRDAADYQSSGAAVSVDLVNGGTAGDAAGDTYIGIEYVYGSSFGDTIVGNDAVNRLVGGSGDDELNGAGGNDYVLGGVGNDTMTGGLGADVFQLATLFGDDTITDFEAGAGRTDRIWFRGLDLEETDLIITDTADGALIDAGGLGTLLLENVLASDLHSDDYIF